MRLASGLLRAPRTWALVAGLLLLLGAPPVHAQSTGERINSYQIEVQVTQPRGDLVVTEVIEYDFGANHRRGILRYIPVRFNYDDRHDRVYPLEVLSVQGSPGTPDDYEVYQESDNTVIRIGDPDRTITGPHRYTISYRVRGAMNGFENHDELYWDVVGMDWEVPIGRVSATVTTPAQVTQVACFAGPHRSSLPCQTAAAEGSRAEFAHPALDPFEALTVVVGIPSGVIAPPAPILEERWSLARAFSVTPVTLAGALSTMGILVWLVYHQVWKRGRDRRYAGSAVDAAMGVGGPEVPVRWRERPGVPVEYVPPEGLKPGQVGTLMDETANTLDVIATIIDLAVHGYLRIEEIPKEGWFGKPDWRLVRLKSETDLKPYERLLFLSIFSAGREQVLLSQLEERFAPRLRSVQDALYKDVVNKGWFSTRPDHVRQTWTAIGVVLMLAGAGILVAAAAFTNIALMAVPFPVAGLLVLGNAHRMPSRTARGTALARRIEGFRKFIEDSEADRARFAERKHLFSEYLPYAIVFGATEKWAKAFEGLEGAMPDTSWYVGSPGQVVTMSALANSMSGFTVATSGTITSTPPSVSGGSGFGGGGFSGGGGGGGGGRSW